MHAKGLVAAGLVIGSVSGCGYSIKAGARANYLGVAAFGTIVALVM
jgi:hypothetical protein